jgi:alanyl-tRNA synthetase
LAVEKVNAKFVIHRFDGVSESKIIPKAAQEFTKALPTVPLLFVGVESERQQVTCLATVPKTSSSKLAANDWVKTVIDRLGGKGGGKEGTAQGTASGGSVLTGLDDALKLADHFAATKLA